MLNKPKDVSLHKLLGTRATLTMSVNSDPRYFDGFVTRAKRGEKRGRYITYTITLQPWLWFLTRTKNSQVFQTQSVKDIVTTVLGTYGTDSTWRVNETDYPKLDYCLQHNETDFDFVNRLLEEAGIYYFFEHVEGTHTMVLIDSMAMHKPRKDSSAINWANAMQDEATITTWFVQEEARSVKAVLGEYDYLAPTPLVSATASADKPISRNRWARWSGSSTRPWSCRTAKSPMRNPRPCRQRSGPRCGLEELTSIYASATGTDQRARPRHSA